MNKNKKTKETKKTGRGRPTKYTPELGDEICEVISSSELGLLHLCNARPHWPDRATIFIWRRKHEDFRNKYTKAKEEQTEVCVEYMQEIMNEPHRYTDPETGRIIVDVPMLRVKIDTIKWQASKLKPKKFGDLKVQETTNSEIDEDLKKRMKEMDEKNRKDC